jgi:hypothetical protein
VDEIILGLAILIGLSTYVLPTIIGRVHQQPSPEEESGSSCSEEDDTWTFDPSKLAGRSTLEQGDHWIL